MSPLQIEREIKRLKKRLCCSGNEVLYSDGPLSGPAGNYKIGVDEATGIFYYRDSADNWTAFSGASGTPGLQSVITQDPVLIANNDIDLNGNVLKFINGADEIINIDPINRRYRFGDYNALNNGNNIDIDDGSNGVLIFGGGTYIYTPILVIPTLSGGTGAGYVLTDVAGDGNATWEPGGVNLYNSDGALTGSRTIDLAGNDLNFVDGSTTWLQISGATGSVVIGELGAGGNNNFIEIADLTDQITINAPNTLIINTGSTSAGYVLTDVAGDGVATWELMGLTQVLTAGNSTPNDIFLTNNDGSVNLITLFTDNLTGGTVQVTSTDGSDVIIRGDYIRFYDAAANNYIGIEAPEPIGANYTLTLPKQNATLAAINVAHDFADDIAAAGGGVPVGSLYHTSGVVKVRLS